MYDRLCAWLNGKKDYWIGVTIYRWYHPEAAIIPMLLKGPTAFTTKYITDALWAVYRQQKNAGKPEIKAEATPDKPQEPDTAKAPAADYSHTELYQSAREEANRQYKEIMNTRALLFSKVRDPHFIGDHNREDLVKERRPLALAIVKGNKLYTDLYDKADYIRTTGQMPSFPVDQQEEEPDLSAMTDPELAHFQENTRKNLSKVKKLKPSPEILNRLQKLEDRMKSIKAEREARKNVAV